MARLVIIVPVLNEAAGLETLVPRLRELVVQGHRVVIADGGSSDGTATRLEGAGFTVYSVPRGRARQMNAAVALAKPGDEDILVFLHADTQVSSDFDSAIAEAVFAHDWGFFAVRIEGRSWLLRLVERMMTLRSRLTAIATGDQVIFVRAGVFRSVGGYQDQPLMEDIDLSRRLRRSGLPAALPIHVITSGRRWEKHGVLRTIVLMWSLRLLYFFGADPAFLARLYGYGPVKK